MDILNYYYFGVLLFILFLSLSKIIIILFPYFEDYFRIKRLKKCVKYYFDK